SDDAVKGYATDIVKSGAVSVVVPSHGVRVLRIVAGSPSFISKQLKVRMAPKEFALSQNYPNPFNPVTAIKLDIPESAVLNGLLQSRVTLDVYNMRGQLVSRLLDMPAEPGYKQVHWNGRSTVGVTVASGNYVYRVQVRDGAGREIYNSTRSMTLLK
ncbi:MAG: hypothetical protein JNL74_05805, partial [Fibrobacteres bacterium]|nr:hypothetical protein [Fibrobacterota bacterium]